MIRQIDFTFCSIINKIGTRAGKHCFITNLAGTLACILAFVGCLSSCSNQIVKQERLVSIPNQAWAQSYQPWVHLDVQDSTHPYRIYAVIRHSQQFKYDNLLLRYGYIAPGDSAIFHEVNLPLAKNDRWLGDTLGTVVETRIKLGPAPQKLPIGDNVFVMAHLMPDEPLIGVLQVGIRIEVADDGISDGAGPAKNSGGGNTAHTTAKSSRSASPRTSAK